MGLLRPKILLYFSIIFLFVSLASAKPSNELVLADSGKTNYAIYYSTQESQIVRFAAQELADYLEKISGAHFSLVTSNTGEKPLIVVGRNNSFVTAHETEVDFDSVQADGFRIVSIGDTILIAGNIDRGTMYGVYHFLDIYLGVRWFSPNFEVVPSKSTLTVSPMNDLENPHFTYREIFSGDTDDGYFRQRNRLNGCKGGTHRSYLYYPPGIDTWSKDSPWGGNNFYEVVPEESYHYGGQLLAMSNGCRSAAVNYFLNKIASKGDEYWWGFSQNDNGWDPDSQSRSFANTHGGALSAPILDMVIDVANQVRQTYPNAKLATLAYQWSFQPPSGITVPDYVMIEIAPIEADFGYPYNSPRNAAADSAFHGWDRIAPSLSIWDYITNFQNYLQPLPNIYAMCENIKFLASLNHLKSYFGEGAYNTSGAEFAALRAWVAARLLWNPDQDYHALIHEFVNGYYGPAAYYIEQYIDALHQSLYDAGDRISVKQRITSNYLNLDFITKADALLASADAVATGDYSEHVHEVRLGVDMTILLREHQYKAEAEKRGITWIHDAGRRSRFEQYVSEAGITQYGEDSPISSLYAAMNVKRVNPPVPSVAEGLPDSAWIDYQDLDFEICCGATLVEDTSASDNGAVRESADGVWSVQMPLDLLPAEGKWDLYAYVRVDPKSNGSAAFDMGVWPGKSKTIYRSAVKDGKYHVFMFPGGPYHFETGKGIWFAGNSSGITNLYIDRIVAVRYGATGVESKKKLPFVFDLEQNYPNPFNPSTSIKFSVPRNERVTLTIFDLLGRKVAVLINNKLCKSGWHVVSWDGKDEKGVLVASGLYYYMLRSDSGVKIKKMIYLH